MFIIPIIVALLGVVLIILSFLCMIAGVLMLITGIVDRELYMFLGGCFFASTGPLIGKLSFLIY